MDIQAYLDRIDYQGPLDPNAEPRRALPVAHLLAEPFENLSIGMGWPIALDEAALFDKIVVRRRGGFCYELNGLFAALLRDLGFHVAMSSAPPCQCPRRASPALMAASAPSSTT